MNTSTNPLNETTAMNLTSAVGLEPFAYRQFVGMGLSLGGNLLISISLTIQKKAHNRLGKENSSRYCFDKYWWLGMILMGLGEMGNFLAYGFAPASMIAPLGSVAVISNTILASVYLGEPLTMASMMGVTLVVVGSVLLISFSVFDRTMLTSNQILQYFLAYPFLVYLCIEFILLLVLLYLKFYKKNEHLLVLIFLVAIVASITIIAAKALSSMVTDYIIEGTAPFHNPIFWIALFILPITTVTQIRFLNRAMQLYDVSDVVPVNFIFFTLSAILAGTMFYQEFRGVSFDRIFMFLFGCMLAFMGVGIIMKQEKNSLEKKKLEEQKSGETTPQTNKFRDSSSAEPPSSESNFSMNSQKDANNTGFVKQQQLPRSNDVSTDGFFSRFVRLIKSTETVTEVQPLVQDLNNF